MLRVLVIALVLLVAVMFLLPRDREAMPQPAVATVLPEPLALPPFELADTAGKPFTASDFENRFSLLFFGYTFCPDICPLTLQVLAAAREDIRNQAPDLVPAVVFVSIDPRRDTPQRMRDYLDNFDREFIGVTGPDEKLAPLIKALGVTVHKNAVEGESYNVTHSGTVYLVGPDAGVRAIFNGSPQDAATIASDYSIIRRRLRSNAGP